MSAERPLTILLVEDDPHSCQELAEAIDLTEDAVLTGVTAHADQAVTLIQDYIPDCLILDLELHAGSGNGFHVLQSMKRLDLPRPPYVVITTNNSSVVTHEAARNLGADFIFTKHQTDYSAKNVIEFLCMIKSVIQSRSNHVSVESMPAETPHMREKRLIRRIHAELDAVGISPKAIGRQYLTDAILLVIDKPERNLPAAIGKKYGKSDSSVERAMQNAISRAWRTADIDTLYRNYTAKIHPDKGVPTITEFICYYADKLRNDFS